MAEGTCDSCGDAVDEQWPVHRRYITPERWDTPGKVETVPEVERWCAVCLWHYPHEPAEGAGDGHPDGPGGAHPAD